MYMLLPATAQPKRWMKAWSIRRRRLHFQPSNGTRCCTLYISIRCLLPGWVFPGKQALILHVIVNSRLFILLEIGRRLADRSGGQTDPRSNVVRSLWRRAVRNRQNSKDLHFSAQERLALVSSEKIHVEPINRARNEQSENKCVTASPDVSDAYCTK